MITLKKFNYTNAQNEQSEKEVLFLNPHPFLIKGVDVTTISEDDRAHLIESLTEYVQYLNANKVLSYETWLKFGKPAEDDAQSVQPLWRTYNATKIDEK